MPRIGPCKPWVAGADLESLPAVQVAYAKATAAGTIQEGQLAALAAEAAMSASQVLYDLSAKQFTGEGCGPVTIRPVERPAQQDFSWPAVLLSLSNMGSTGMPFPVGVLSRYGDVEPPTIDLGASFVNEIVQVKIDGAIIPAAEYELQGGRKLIRILPNPPAQPTERWGWPTTQKQDAKDDQPGTFSVTFKYGIAPPVLGSLAARTLAERVLRGMLGDTSGYPSRVTSMTRQGVSANVVDVMDVVKSGSTGIYPVDLFLLTYNPKKRARRAGVYSPDVGRPRRVTIPD